MAAQIPNLPPIKKHVLNIEKAANRVKENISSYHDSGITSRSYQVFNAKEVNL